MTTAEYQESWATWRSDLWDAMEARMGYPGLAHHEQVTRRSVKEKRCAECGIPTDKTHVSSLVKVVPHYYFCAECEAWYKAKHS